MRTVYIIFEILYQSKRHRFHFIIMQFIFFIIICIHSLI